MTQKSNQRIEGVNPAETDKRTKAILDAQAKKWGGPLINHLVYAHNPHIFKAVRGMWGGLDQSGLLDAPLVALVNRRVAFHNNCPF